MDDDQNIVESLKIVLEKEGLEVRAQYDEKDLIQNLTSYQPDLIFLDVMFPENSSAGFEMAREIRNNDDLAQIPLFMLSAINEHNLYPGKFTNRDRHETWLPVDQFIEKPIEPNNLVEKVRNVLA